MAVEWPRVRGVWAMSRNEQVSEKLCAFCSPFWGWTEFSRGRIACRRFRRGRFGGRHVAGNGDTARLETCATWGPCCCARASLTGGGFKRPPLYFEFTFCPCSLFCFLVVPCCLNVPCLAVSQSLADPESDSECPPASIVFTKCLLPPTGAHKEESCKLSSERKKRDPLACAKRVASQGRRGGRPAPHWL